MIQTWDITLAHLLELNAASKDPIDIAEIWLFEAANHGDSAIVNAGKLGAICTFVSVYPIPNFPSDLPCR